MRTRSNEESPIKQASSAIPTSFAAALSWTSELSQRSALCAPLQGFTHEEWTDSGGSAREGNEIAASQSLTTLRDPHLREIPLRCVKRETNLSELATNEF